MADQKLETAERDARSATGSNAAGARNGEPDTSAAGDRAPARTKVPALPDMPVGQQAAMLAAVADSVPQIIWYKDIRNNILWANRAALARAGRGADELLGRSCFDLSPREAAEYFQEDLRLIESKEALLGIVHGFRRANGERLWVITDKYPCFGPGGEVVGIVAITRDMSDLDGGAPGDDRVEDFRLPRELIHLTIDGSATFVSAGWCRMLGIERHAALGHGWLSAVHPEDVPVLRREWERAVDDRRPVVQVRFRVMQGESTRPIPLDLRAVPEFDEQGRVAGFLASVSPDWSDSEKVAADKEQRRLIEAMATTAPVGMYVADPTGHCSYVNDQWCRMWGIERAQARSLGWIMAIHEDDRNRVTHDGRRAMQEKRPYSGEFRLKHRDGSERWVLSRAVPLLDAKGEVTALVGTTTDITSRKRAEEEVLRLNRELEQRVTERTNQMQDAIKELEAFCYAVSHDLRAPLRSLDGFSHALLEEYSDKLDGHGLDWLRRLRAGSQRMGRLIDDLLALSRLSRGSIRRERVDLSQLAADVVEDLEQGEEGRNVDIDIEPGMACSGDPLLLRLVIQNLIGNAWKFTARRTDASVHFFSARNLDGERVYSISDNGVGFDMAYSSKLFGMFNRLHHPSEFEGTGIGLANVRRIVERHGGRVWAEGKPGAGATFSFTLSD